MSRSTYDVKETYTGTGSLATYTFDFKITDKSQLLVIEVNDSGVETQRVDGDDVTYLSSVTFDEENGGGTVVLAANLTSGYKLIFLLAEDSPKQTYEFRNKTSFTLKKFENALDEIAGAVQRLAYRAKQTFRIHDLDDEETIDLQLPPNFSDNPNTVPIINSTADGLIFGPTANEIQNAQGYAEAASDSADAAATSETNAATSEANAATSEANAAAALASAFYRDIVYIDNTDSPLTITQAHNGKLIQMDSSGGAITINLPSISGLALPFNIAFKLATAGNTVTINRNGTDTIEGATSVSLALAGQGYQLVADDGASPDQWGRLDLGIVPDLSVVTAKLASEAVTAAKMATGAVTAAKMATGAVAKRTVTSKTAAYTVTTADQINLGDATSAAFTYTLPTAVGNSGLELVFKKTDSSSNAITVDGDGSETIDGEITIDLEFQNDFIKIISDGTNWQIIEKFLQFDEVFSAKIGTSTTITSQGHKDAIASVSYNGTVKVITLVSGLFSNPPAVIVSDNSAHSSNFIRGIEVVSVSTSVIHVQCTNHRSDSGSFSNSQDRSFDIFIQRQR